MFVLNVKYRTIKQFKTNLFLLKTKFTVKECLQTLTACVLLLTQLNSQMVNHFLHNIFYRILKFEGQKKIGKQFYLTKLIKQKWQLTWRGAQTLFTRGVQILSYFCYFNIKEENAYLVFPLMVLRKSTNCSETIKFARFRKLVWILNFWPFYDFLKWYLECQYFVPLLLIIYFNFIIHFSFTIHFQILRTFWWFFSDQSNSGRSSRENLRYFAFLASRATSNQFNHRTQCAVPINKYSI